MPGDRLFSLEMQNSWRRQAGSIRHHAAKATHLGPDNVAWLLREADAADRQADWWLAAAIESNDAYISADQVAGR